MGRPTRQQVSVRLPAVMRVACAVAVLALAGCTARQAPRVAPVPEPEPVAAAEPVAPAPQPEPSGVDLGESLLDPDELEPAPGEEISESPVDELADAIPELSPEQLEAERRLVEDHPPSFDIPMETNAKVMAWVDHYSNRRPDEFVQGLRRSGRYLEMFREIFRDAGLPQDLVYLAHVESAYKTTAYSRARAKGIFQFIAATGRRYGLRIDYWVDERSDPEKSARAATRYLSDLYDEFGDWYLALAGYNAGEGRVRRAVRRTGKRDFWAIDSPRHLRRETRNYVPAVLATALISKEPGKYGFRFEPDPPVVYDSVRVEGPADLRVLAECAGTDFDTMKRLNPALRRYQTPPGATTDVRVPVGAAERTLVALEKIPRNERVLYARHRVRPGDTLSDLAGAYGVSVRAIQDSNGMGRRTMIRVGQELVIPSVARAGRPVRAPAPAAAAVASGDPVAYRVRRGDTLSHIARRYGTTPSAIAAASGISVHKTLSIGERLTVVPGVRSASAAQTAVAGEANGHPASDGTIHVVRRGDTLWHIARRYGTTPAAIATANGFGVHDTLRIGTRLAIVPGRSPASAQDGGVPVLHTVRSGDTLWRLARRYDTTIDSICALNGIRRDTTLYPGSKLTVLGD